MDSNSLAWICDHPEAMMNLKVFHVTTAISCFYNTAPTLAIHMVHAVVVSCVHSSFVQLNIKHRRHSYTRLVTGILLPFQKSICVRLGVFSQCPQLQKYVHIT